MDKQVTHPKHYNQGNIETLEFLTEKFGLPYVLGQVVKYCSRAGKKDNTLQDIEKAIFYSTWAKEVETAKKEKRPACKPNELFEEGPTAKEVCAAWQQYGEDICSEIKGPDPRTLYGVDANTVKAIISDYIKHLTKDYSLEIIEANEIPTPDKFWKHKTKEFNLTSLRQTTKTPNPEMDRETWGDEYPDWKSRL